MRTISEIMTPDVAVVAPYDTIQHAAQMMDDWDIGALPVCDGQRLVGMITDRDIATRSTSAGEDPAQTRVSEVMTDEALWCFEDQSVGEVLQEMGDLQLRRIPVVNRDMQLVGVVSLGDIATRYGTNVGSTLEDISTPSEPTRPAPGDTKSPSARH